MLRDPACRRMVVAFWTALLLTTIAFYGLRAGAFEAVMRSSKFSILCDSCNMSTRPPLPGSQADEEVVNHIYKHRRTIGRWRNSCLNVSFSLSANLPSTALASYPGSGNTWTRHLIELLTGFYTGAIYKDPTLVAGFPGEGNVSQSCVVVKTHWPWYLGTRDKLPYKRAVLVIREPLAAIKAEYKRASSVRKSHTEQLKMISPRDWANYVELQVMKNVNFHQFWFNLTESRGMDMFLLFYSDLKRAPRRALSNLAHFLGVENYAKHLDCVLAHSEGSYHRAATPASDPFAGLSSFPLRVAGVKYHIDSMVKKCIRDGHCVTSGSTELPST